MKDLLTTRQLQVEIGSTLVCQDLDLHISPQSCWGLLGPNGAGKTTLLHTFAGLLPVSSGQIMFRQQDLHSISRHKLAKQLGLLLQMEETGFPGNLLESVMSSRHPHLGYWGWESETDLQITRDAINAFGLSGLEQRSINALSGGERRRMDMATLLAQQPLLALLDEPSNHLDPGQQIACLNLLTGYFQQSGHALIMALHDINLATRYCDHLLLLQGNGNWLAGPVEQIATMEHISELYQHPMDSVQGPRGPLFVAQ
jgi:iron complex transport system ATP-binding protein